MLLAIDIGNTNIVFAVYDGEVEKGQWRCRTEVGRTADEYLAFLSQHFELVDLHRSDIESVIVSSVVPDTDADIERFCRRGFGIVPLFVTAAIAESLDLTVQTDRPSEVGADRLVNAIAVRELYGSPAVVVDFGTATTFDVVDADGAFCGGVIAPGPNLSMKALHLAAAKLPSVRVKAPKAAVGKNTVDAMQSGIYWGYVGLVKEILARIEAELGQKPVVIATGGLAPLFAADLPEIREIDDDLTMKGLLIIVRRLKKQ